jgi:hypothetical protein
MTDQLDRIFQMSRAGLPAWVLNLNSVKNEIDRSFKLEIPVEVVCYQCVSELDQNERIGRREFPELFSLQAGMANCVELVNISEREQRKIIYKFDKYSNQKWQEVERQLNTILYDGSIKIFLSSGSLNMRNPFERPFTSWKDFLIEFGLSGLPSSLFRLSRTYPDSFYSGQNIPDKSEISGTGWYSSFDLIKATLQTIDYLTIAEAYAVAPTQVANDNQTAVPKSESEEEGSKQNRKRGQWIGPAIAWLKRDPTLTDAVIAVKDDVNIDPSQMSRNPQWKAIRKATAGLAQESIPKGSKYDQTIEAIDDDTQF